jgi:hypothetical protein
LDHFGRKIIMGDHYDLKIFFQTNFKNGGKFVKLGAWATRPKRAWGTRSPHWWRCGHPNAH